MARLDPGDYLRHIREESRRFRDVLAACDPTARVPGCPEWDAADLLWHLAQVQLFWATRIRRRPEAPTEADRPPRRPDTHAGLLAAFDDHSRALLTELEAADPAEAAWSWSTEQTVGFTLRRQAHEALVHRLDAEQTAGTVTPLDPALAADGVEECLDVMFGGTPPWGTFTGLPQHVRTDIVDTGESVWVQVGRFTGTDPQDGTSYDDDDIHVVPDPGTEPDVVVSGRAEILDAWLWRRGDDREILVTGDPEVVGRFRRSVDHPVN